MKYFDHDATTPLGAAARQAWLEAVDRFPGNPSSPHRVGERANVALDEAREELSSWLGCSPLDLVWTGGATEAGNTVFHHYWRRFPDAEEIWVSAVEHPSVLAAAERYFGKRARRISVTEQGVVDPAWLADQTALPGLVAVMAANNETGILQPWEEIGAWCRERNIPFICDAAQWIGKLPSAGLGQCDWVMGSAHKFGGPVGVGFLKCPARGVTTPLLVGGPQERLRRSGTEDVAGVLALTAALRECESRLTSAWIEERLRRRRRFEERLREQMPGVSVLGVSVPRLWNTLSLIMPASDCRFRWVVKLDRNGFAVSTGSACSSGKESASHVLMAMGIEAEAAGRAIRCSSGPDTGEADWEELGRAMARIHREENRKPSQLADRESIGASSR